MARKSRNAVLPILGYDTCMITRSGLILGNIRFLGFFKLLFNTFKEGIVKDRREASAIGTVLFVYT